jgi:WD40 repeat protein
MPLLADRGKRGLRPNEALAECGDSVERGWPVAPAVRLGRWCRRNRRALGLSAFAVLLIAVAVAATAPSADGPAGKESEAEGDASALRRAVESARRRALAERARAEKERNVRVQALKRAEGLRLIAHAFAVLPTDPTLALLLGIEGAWRAPGVLADDALLAALDACYEERILPAPVYLLTCTGQGRLLTLSDKIGILDPATGKYLASWEALANCASASPDGKRVVTWATSSAQLGRSQNFYTNRVARVWDASTGKQVCMLKGHTARLMEARFSPDGKTIATASQDKTARLWDARTGKELRRFACKGAVGLACFSADGKRLLTVAADRQHEDWYRTPTGYPPGRKVEVDPLEIEPPSGGGSYPSSGSSGPNGDPMLARVWDVRSGKELAGVAAPLGSQVFGLWCVIDGAFSPDGTRVLLSQKGGRDVARICDSATGKVRATLQIPGETTGPAVFSSPPDRVVGVPATFSPDGSRVLGVAGKAACIWDADSGAVGAILRGHEQAIRCASFSPDGKLVVTAGDDGTVRVWNVRTGEQTASLKGHSAPVRRALFQPDGRRVLSAGDDGTIRFWHLAPPRPYARTLEGHTGAVGSVAFSPDGRQVLTASEDSTARTWDLATGKPLAVLQGLGQLGKAGCRRQILGVVMSACYSPDGRRVLVLNHQTKARIVNFFGRVQEELPFTPVRIFDARTGKEETALPGGAACACFSPDGKRVLVGEGGCFCTGDSLRSGGYKRIASETVAAPAARIHDSRTGKVLVKLALQVNRGIDAVAFSPDGKLAATVAGDPGGWARSKVWLWDSRTGKQLRAWQEGQPPAVQKILFSPNGRLLYLAFKGAGTIVREVATGKQVGYLEGELAPSPGGPFSPDGRKLLALGSDNTVRVWGAFSGKLLRELHGHTSRVYAAEFSKDGRRVRTASADETVRVWDVAAEKEIRRSRCKQACPGAVFSPDGKQIACAASATVTLWNLDLLAARARKPRDLTAAERQRYEVPDER